MNAASPAAAGAARAAERTAPIRARLCAGRVTGEISIRLTACTCRPPLGSLAARTVRKPTAQSVERAGLHQRVRVAAGRAVEHQAAGDLQTGVILADVFPDADRLRRIVVPQHERAGARSGMRPQAVGESAGHPLITECVALGPCRSIAAEDAGFVRGKPDLNAAYLMLPALAGSFLSTGAELTGRVNTSPPA